MMQENRAFMEMMKVAKEWLADRNPLDIAEKTGIHYNAQRACFYLSSMGTEIYIPYPDYEITPYINEWHQLIILHYMKLADGAPLTGNWMSMREVKDGLIRGGDFDLKCENMIRQRLSRISIEEFSEKCRGMGGRILDSNADLAVRFDVLPYYPLLLKLWLADEEFPASGKLLVDTNADHYLTIEDAVTVGQMVMEKLAGLF